MLSAFRRPALATLAGTFVLVAWGMLFWGLLASPLGMFHVLPGNEQITSVLQLKDAPTGTYFVPWPRDTPEQFDAFIARHKAGSFYKLSYIKEGVDPASPAKNLLGTLQYVTVSAMAVALLLIARREKFTDRFLIVLIGGLLGTNLITVGDPVWFHMPTDYATGALIFEVVCWLLLAATTAKLVQPAKNDDA
jgi:hypothetical protein